MPETTAIERLWAAVQAQTGPSRSWHLDDLSNHQQRYLADLNIVAALRPAGTILEVGAAPCHMTALLTLSGYATIAVDIDPDRVNGLVQQLGLDVRRCDIERSPLPFTDESFAMVLLCETFEHLRIDPSFVLSEINRVLRPGGMLVLTTPNLYSLPNLFRWLTGRSIADPLDEFSKLRRLGHMGHVREYSAAEVLRFVHAHGLQPRSVAYRYHAEARGRRARLLRAAYRIAPRRFRREIVIVATKEKAGPRLAALLPAAD